jgi:serine/threonine protein kinase
MNKQIFLVLEYLRGGELLKAVCNRQRYTEDDARALMLQILQGISHIHKKGVIHRDIKPENLILAKKSLDSPIKIVDFGFATLITEQEEEEMFKRRLQSQQKGGKHLEKSSEGFLCGTPGYMAPEVLKNRQYSTACDMWATGVVMYVHTIFRVRGLLCYAYVCVVCLGGYISVLLLH